MKEEKIALLIDELEDIRCDNFDADTDEDKTLKEAIKVIKALEQESCNKCVYSTKDGYCQYDDITEAIPPFEPCEDAINKQAVLDILVKYDNYIKFDVYSEIFDSIDKLSPVNPQESKTQKVIQMREATPEERESIDKYIKSISEPTVVNFWDLEQQPKTGHWIKMFLTDTSDIDGQCSECGFIHKFIDGHTAQYNYCPNCGAKMIEREDK